MRLRNDELETLNLEQQHQIKTLTSQVHDLQQDNVKLFEKIRFLQSCGGSPRYSSYKHKLFFQFNVINYPILFFTIYLLDHSS